MQENEKNIDNQLRNAFSDYREAPRPEAWEGVRSSIAKAREDRRKKRFLFYRWWFIVALLLFTIASTVVAYRYLNNRGSVIVKEEAIQAEQSNTIGKEPVQTVVDNNTAAMAHEMPDTENNETTKVHQKEAVFKHETVGGSLEKQVNNTNTNIADDNINTGGSTTAGVKNTFNSTPVNKGNVAIPEKQQRDATEIDPLKTKQATSIPVQQKGRNAQHSTAPLPDVIMPSIAEEQGNTITDQQERNDTKPAAKAQSKAPGNTPVANSGGEKPVPAKQQDTNNLQGPQNNIAKANKQNEDPQNTADTMSSDSSRQKLNEDIAEQDKPEKIKGSMLSKISAGVKAGYQSSFTTSNNADKYVVAGFVQYNITDNLAVMIQPAYMSGTAEIAAKTSEQVYYNITSANFDTSSIRYFSNNIRAPDTLYRSYDYYATYDSTRVSTKLSDTKLWDVEIPLVFKYRIFKGVFITAGGIGAFSKTLSYTEERRDYTNLQFSYTESFDPVIVAPGEPEPPYPDQKTLNELYTFTGEKIDNYKPAATSNVQSFFRWGYTIGLSAEFKKRLLLDVGMLQMPTYKLNNDADIKELYTKPYFRLMLGYKIKK